MNTNLTIRLDQDLKTNATKQAAKLGIPLTLIVTTALKNFVASPRIIIGDPEMIPVNPEIQRKIDKITKLLSK